MAIDELLDEHEQSERVREWLHRNGSALVLGIGLGLAAIFGWQWWQGQREAQKSQAAMEYQVAAAALQAKDVTAEAKVKAVPEGLFRALAQLDLAKTQVEAGQEDQALKTLQGIKTDDAAVTNVISERIARLMIQKGQAEGALKVIGDVDTLGALEARGDAQMALGQLDKARDTYNQALLKAEVGSLQRRKLELKLAEAGGTPPKTESKS